MKKFIALLLVSILSISVLQGCGSSGSGDVPSVPQLSDNRVINVWAFTPEIPDAINRYKEFNPSFDWEINVTVINDQDGAYEVALEQALVAGGASAPDLYTAEQAFVMKFTQGGFSSFAIPYSYLIDDLDSKIAAAQVAQYAVDVGTRNGEIVGMRFQETGACLIYRRSIAIDTWGTDNPAEIEKITGPGWDQFLVAAAELNAKGYSIVSGDDDIYKVLKDGAAQGWLVDGKITIDPNREYLFDLAEVMHSNNYWNGSVAWNESWNADMSDNGIRPVFAFLGPAWLINYVMADNAGSTYGDWAVTMPPVPFTWGGTWLIANQAIDSMEKREAVGKLIEWVTLDTSDTGFQYFFANGTLYDEPGTKDTVASRVVMEKSDGTLDFLAGQNMFDYFIPAAAAARADHWTEHDRYIDEWYLDQVRMFYMGNKSKEQAIADFKQKITDELGFE
ncbi:MAG: carbohydrate ABC transporter substrate-binding protein [Lachnospiraceae bacterium]|nr:carbohydrate ABC transporter substrate-binding protein [Lachnospiraceae bacterium]